MAGPSNPCPESLMHLLKLIQKNTRHLCCTLRHHSKHCIHKKEKKNLYVDKTFIEAQVLCKTRSWFVLYRQPHQETAVFCTKVLIEIQFSEEC